MMFIPVFTLNLNLKILPGRVTIGEYDGQHPCLTAATTGEKVFIHNPHQRLGAASGRWFGGGSGGGRMEASQGSQEVTMLNVNQRVTAVAAGNMDPLRSSHDTLLIGTPTNLLAYDVERNADLFYKEVADGVNVLAVGRVGDSPDVLALVGGNCSLQGFDREGHDPFWTVTGDNVSSLALMDCDGDGRNYELVVGSEDFAIRIFSGEEIRSEIAETEAVTGLCHVQGGRFGYALANGTVGVYERTTRWWRIKSKNSATCIFNYDLDGDGVKELITGWSNGKLDARNDRTGEVVFKDTFSHAVAGIAQGDYRLDGRLELVVCGSEGEVRGYLPSSAEARAKLANVGADQECLRDLAHRKQNLLLELRNYDENRKMGSEVARQHGGGSGGTSHMFPLLAGPGSRGTAADPSPSSAEELMAKGAAVNKDLGMIPAQTQLSTSLSINLGTTDGQPPHVEVTLSTSNSTVIRAVLIFAEGIFDGECHVVHPREHSLASSVVVPIFPPRDVPVDLHIRALVGFKGSRHFHVFELTRQLPRFSMHCRVPHPQGQAVAGEPSPPEGHVSFKVNDRTARVAMWMNQNFLVAEELEPNPGGGSLEVAFASLRHQMREMRFEMTPDGGVTIRCDDMDLCGDLVQSLAEYLGVDDLKSTCDFPREFARVGALLDTAEELQAVRQRLSAEMADNSGSIRTLIVRAEDSRLMGDMASMKKWYAQLNDLNKDLISSYKIRCNNQMELVDTLKQVNLIIQKAGKIRVGKSKAKLISDCRNAIKTSNVDVLVRVMKSGAS